MVPMATGNRWRWVPPSYGTAGRLRLELQLRSLQPAGCASGLRVGDNGVGKGWA